MYRFKRDHRTYKRGDEVPSTYSSGMIATMIQRQIVEEFKHIDAPPADKAMRSERMSRKNRD